MEECIICGGTGPDNGKLCVHCMSYISQIAPGILDVNLKTSFDLALPHVYKKAIPEDFQYSDVIK